jgi:hypothetical protein
MSLYFFTEKNISIEQSNFSELYFLQIGSNWTTDSINLFLIVPLSSICLLINFICSIVFLNLKFCKQNYNKPFKQPPSIYDYFKINSFNSCLFSLIMLFSLVTFAPRYIHLSTSYFSKFYRCIIINYLGISLYSFGNFIDIIIGFERLSIFSKRLKKLSLHFRSSYKLCFILFLFCLIINLPAYFWYYIPSEQEFYSSFINNHFSYCGQIDFMHNTMFGQFLTGLMLFIRDILCLSLEIATGILLIITSTKFLTKKKRLSGIKRNKNPKKKLNHSDLNKQFDTSLSLLSSQTPQTPITTNSLNEKKLTLISIYLLFFTIITHTFAIVCALFHFVFGKTIVSQYLILMTIFLVLLKNTCNFLVFFYFDQNFKHTIKKFDYCLNRLIHNNK